MRLVIIAALACLPFLAGTDARAQSGGLDPMLQDFLSSDGYERIVVSAALEADEALVEGCAQRKAVTREFLAELERVVFVKNRAAPVDGKWLERVEIDRCGKSAWQTIMFTVDDKGEMNLQPLLAGQTRVLDPASQLEVARTVYSSDIRQAQGCTDRRIVDTRIATRPVGADGPWIERWFVLACGEIRAHNVTMSRQPGGGLVFEAKPAG